MITTSKEGIEKASLKESSLFELEIQGEEGHTASIISWLLAFFKGQEALLPPLHLPLLSHFEEKVRSELLNSKIGETVSYGDLAKRIGRPRAARAVGNALSKNPIPLFIPCHRVVHRDSIGCFAFGKEVKSALIEFESMVTS